MPYDPTILLNGLYYGEAPRWHEGRLWLSDMHGHQVLKVDMNGHVEKVVEVPNQPSGLGWLPDGRLLIVSMIDRKLMRLDPVGLTVVADLSSMASYHCNDMVVNVNGDAYVGNFGSDWVGRLPDPANLILVKPDGKASIVAEGLEFPNGSVITPDGRTLILAETFGRQLTAFDINKDGTLTNRRVWADVSPAYPDGICLDSENAVWIPSAEDGGKRVLRIAEGGKVLDHIDFNQNTYACALGGEGRRTLFVLTADSSVPTIAKAKPTGRVVYVRVKIPGAGLP
jgi:sugar lactone lactonase YvrE